MGWPTKGALKRTRPKIRPARGMSNSRSPERPSSPTQAASTGTSSWAICLHTFPTGLWSRGFQKTPGTEEDGLALHCGRRCRPIAQGHSTEADAHSQRPLAQEAMTLRSQSRNSGMKSGTGCGGSTAFPADASAFPLPTALCTWHKTQHSTVFNPVPGCPSCPHFKFIPWPQRGRDTVSRHASH